MYILRKITFDDIHQLQSYKKAMLESKSSMDGCSGLSSQNDLNSYVARCMAYEQGIDVDKGHVPATQFVCLNENGIIIGMCSIRHCLNDLLIHVGGHIGYSVHPRYRRQGVATFMLKEMIKICNNMHTNPVLLTCLKENEGSKKTIIKCGGIYQDTRHIGNNQIERYWIKR